jgi:TPP-dependent pyruvate/acetoin dehydrogenase alpha subunit
MAQTAVAEEKEISKNELKAEILNDFKLANYSREISLMGRKEVLTGKAKFGILGDGKELGQIALAKQWLPGDWRSGYYRDQTMMMAAGLLTGEQFFAQLYAHADVAHEPASGGRMMNGHYATRSLDENGNWLDLANQVILHLIFHQLRAKCRVCWAWLMQASFSRIVLNFNLVLKNSLLVETKSLLEP